MSDNIPPPGIVYNHILTRLPVKSLLRFRCVCKPWLSVIDSHDFVKSHLNHSISTKSNTVIYTRDDNDSHAYTVECVPVDKSTAVDFNTLLILTKKKYTRNDFLGSVNGIVCSTWCCQVAGVEGFSVDLCLWNPSIAKHILIPSSVQTLDAIPSLGFGYDSFADDYKVFMLEQDWKVSAHNHRGAVLSWGVKVFSLKSKSWTRGKTFPLHLRYNQERGYFVNGSLHWILTPTPAPYQKPHNPDNVVLAINVGSEEFQLLSLPELASPSKKSKKKIIDTSLEALEGNLCLLCHYILGQIDIWIMKDYGKKESWTRLISLDQCQCVRPLAYSKDGGQVLLEIDDERLLWYDLGSKKVMETGIQGTPNFVRKSMLYVESLVQLPCLSNFNLKDVQNIKKKKTKMRIAA